MTLPPRSFAPAFQRGDTMEDEVDTLRGILVGVLTRHDVARRTVRATGLARFAALAMLAGYAWLALAGAVWLVGPPDGAAYDAQAKKLAALFRENDAKFEMPEAVRKAGPQG